MSPVAHGTTFFNTVFYVSVLPFICFPLVFAGDVTANTATVKQMLLFLANAHIAVTLYFYWDRDFRGILTSNPRRYVWFPLAAVVGSGLSYAVLPVRLSDVWWMAFTFWQNWHFSKQNFGIYALISRDQTPDSRVSAFERRLLLGVSAAGAVGGLFLVVGDASPLRSMALALRGVAGYATLALLATGAVYLVLSWQRFTLERAAFFLFALLFFGPQFVTMNADVGFTTYSLSHSLQYLFFMTVIAFNASPRPGAHEGRSETALLSALVFFSCVLVGGAVLTIRGDFAQLLGPLGTSMPSLARFVVGATFGLVVAHFIVDAHAWRLRDTPQREFVLDRFHFIGRSPMLAVSVRDGDAA